MCLSYDLTTVYQNITSEIDIKIPYTINMKTVLLVRHGETLHNTQRVFQSDDAPLSDVGRRQIEKLLPNIEGEDFTIVLSSPLTRAIESAKIISDHKSIPLETLDLLVEFKNPPHIRGQSYDDPAADSAYREWLSTLEQADSINSSDVENYFDLYARADAVLKAFIDRPESCIIAVSHSELIRAVVSRLLLGESANPLQIRDAISRIKLGNSRTVRLLYDDKKSMWRLAF